MKIIERSYSTKDNGIAGFMAYPETNGARPGAVSYSSQGRARRIHQNRDTKVRQARLHHFCDQCFRAAGVSRRRPISSLGRRFRPRPPDPEFTRVLTEGWRFLLKQPNVNKSRVAVCGYCMGGRIAIHFVAATPEVRAFVGYYPTVRAEPDSPLRPIHPSVAVKKFRCPSINLVRRR